MNCIDDGAGVGLRGREGVGFLGLWVRIDCKGAQALEGYSDCMGLWNGATLMGYWSICERWICDTTVVLLSA